MPTVIMPKMGDAMEEGTLLRWLKQEGEEVAEGEPIAEIETDKVTLEIEAAEGGVLTKTLVGEGQTVPIGTAIATIGEDGEVEAAQGLAQAGEMTHRVPPETEAALTNGRPTAEAEATEAAPAPTARHADADGAAVDALRQAQAAQTCGNGAATSAASPVPAPDRAPG